MKTIITFSASKDKSPNYLYWKRLSSSSSEWNEHILRIISSTRSGLEMNFFKKIVWLRKMKSWLFENLSFGLFSKLYPEWTKHFCSATILHSHQPATLSTGTLFLIITNIYRGFCFLYNLVILNFVSQDKSLFWKKKEIKNKNSWIIKKNRTVKCQKNSPHYFVVAFHIYSQTCIRIT